MHAKTYIYYIDFLFFTLHELIRSLRESIHNDPNNDNQKTPFQLLVRKTLVQNSVLYNQILNI